MAGEDGRGQKRGGAVLGGFSALIVAVLGYLGWQFGGADRVTPPEPLGAQSRPAGASLPAETSAPKGASAGTEAPSGVAALAVPEPEPEAVGGTETEAVPEAVTAAVPEARTEAAPVPEARTEAVPEAEVTAVTGAVRTDVPEATDAGTGAAGRVDPAATAAADTAKASADAAAAVRFDTLRVTPEGALTLAGAVEPGARVELLLDGQVIDTVTAAATGDFAAVTSAVPSAEARALSLRVTGADGVARVSDQNLTVAPSPLALAAAATEAGKGAETLAAELAAAQVLAEKPLVTDATGAARVLAEAAKALVIDTLSFDAEGSLAVAGRGAPAGALLRAYIDNAEAGLEQAGADGAFALSLPAVAPGPHSLRLDALDAAGRVLARAEQVFEGIAPPAPVAALPAASAPVSGTTDADAGAGEPKGAETHSGAAKVRMMTVVRGHTLWAIARDSYGDPYLYVQIFAANRDQIRDPDLIYPGQVFVMP